MSQGSDLDEGSEVKVDVVSSRNSLSPSPRSSSAVRGKQWRWTDQSSLLLVGIVYEDAIWAAPYGTKAARWDAICKQLVTELYQEGLQPRSAPTPLSRSCQDRYTVLYNKAAELARSPEARTGTSEAFDEIDQLLLKCVEATQLSEKVTAAEDAKVQERKSQTEATQSRAREHTLAALGKRMGPLARPALSSIPPSSSVSDSSSSSSSPSSPSSAVLPSVASEGEGPTYKRSRPTLRLQREGVEAQKASVEVQRAAFESVTSVGNAMVVESRRTNDEAKRANDLFERMLNRM